jgi:hypothetical protein
VILHGAKPLESRKRETVFAEMRGMCEMKMKCRVQLYLSAHDQAQHVESLQLSYAVCDERTFLPFYIFILTYDYGTRELTKRHS